MGLETVGTFKGSNKIRGIYQRQGIN